LALVSKAKAARLAGCSRTTIHRYINEGKLSESDGQIDTSELMRVFGEISEQTGGQSSERSGDQPVTPQSTTQPAPLLHQLLAEKDKRIEEISQDRDRWRNLAEEQTLRLTNQTKSGPEPAQVLVAMGMLAILVAVVFLASTIT
jgi:hypothetical protein